MDSCNCLTGLANMGYDCAVNFDRVYKMIFVQNYGSDGTRNTINPSVALNQAFLDAKINAVNPADRWYITPELKDVVPTTADTTFKEFNDGSKERVRSGIISWAAIFNNKNHTFACKLAHNNCIDFGVYLIDIQGNVLGLVLGDKLAPIPIQAFDPKYMFQSTEQLSHVALGFDFAPIVNVCSLDMIEVDNIEADLLGAKGLLDVYAKVLISTVGNIEVKFQLSYGSFGKKIGVAGVEVADIVSLKNVTQNTTLTVVSVTEDTVNKGTYTIVYTPSTTVATDILQLEIQKDNFDFNPVKDTIITVA